MTVTEGDAGEMDMNFTITLSGSPNAQVEIRATVWAKDATNPAKGGRGAGRDFLGFKDRNLVFAANASGAELSKTVTVKVLGDEVDEDDETLILRFNNIRTTDGRVVFSSGKPKLEVTGTIRDDGDAMDVGHVISASGVTVDEETGGGGKAVMNFTITLSGSPSHEVTVSAHPRSKKNAGTATHGVDFRHYHKDRKIVFAANATGAELTKTVPIYVLPDVLDEDDETIVLRLHRIESEDHRIRFAGGKHDLEVTGTILDNDRGEIAMRVSNWNTAIIFRLPTWLRAGWALDTEYQILMPDGSWGSSWMASSHRPGFPLAEHRPVSICASSSTTKCVDFPAGTYRFRVRFRNSGDEWGAWRAPIVVRLQ